MIIMPENTGNIPRLFGTNGVRGEINRTIDAAFAARLGLALAHSLRQRYGWARVKIGMDTRVSSEMLKSAMISGLLSGGAEVVDIGLCPSPAIQYAVRSDERCNGGAIITASHNPPQFNGIKCISADGTEMGREEEIEIERLFFSEIPAADWRETGNFSVDEEANESYIEAVLSKIDVKTIKERRFRVVIDCANGAASYTSPYLLERLGCEVISLNCHPDGSFPGHMSEPTEENLKDTARVVSALKADVGIAHDGDADRAVFIDENGRYLSGNISLSIFAGYEVHNAIKSGTERPVVVTPVDSSVALSDIVSKAGGVVRYTKIGSPVVARVMMRERAVFGGEGNGGAIFPEMQYCRDGAMSAAKMLEIMAITGKKLSELADEIPSYYQAKNSINYSSLLEGRGIEAMSEIKVRFMKTVEQMIENGLHISFPIVEKNSIDGIKLHLNSGESCSSWVLIRPSGTEPIIRVVSEACDKETAEKLVSEVMHFVHLVMGSLKNN